jgi:hypothetical protein
MSAKAKKEGDVDELGLNTNEVDIRSVSVPEPWAYKMSGVEWDDRSLMTLYHTTLGGNLAGCLVNFGGRMRRATHCPSVWPQGGPVVPYDGRLFKLANGRIFYLTAAATDQGAMHVFEILRLDRRPFHCPDEHTNYLFCMQHRCNVKDPVPMPGSVAKNWSPWEARCENKRVDVAEVHITHTLCPHRIFKVNLFDGSVSPVAETSTTLQPTSWWSIAKRKWQTPVPLRLNTPAVLLPCETHYLSMFHTLRLLPRAEDEEEETAIGYHVGFYEFEAHHPYRVSRISRRPCIDPRYEPRRRPTWFEHLPGAAFPQVAKTSLPFYPFSLLLCVGAEHKPRLVLLGNSCERLGASCTLDLQHVLDSLETVA